MILLAVALAGGIAQAAPAPPVTLVKNGSALKCAKCRRVYPIKDDIPVMLLDEATIDPE